MSNQQSNQQSTKSPLDLTWTDVEKLRKYTTEAGKILPRAYTGLTSKAHRHITLMIKRARNMLLMK